MVITITIDYRYKFNPYFCGKAKVGIKEGLLDPSWLQDLTHSQVNYGDKTVQTRGGWTWLSTQLIINILYKTHMYLKHPLKYCVVIYVT